MFEFDHRDVDIFSLPMSGLGGGGVGGARGLAGSRKARYGRLAPLFCCSDKTNRDALLLYPKLFSFSNSVQASAVPSHLPFHQAHKTV